MWLRMAQQQLAIIFGILFSFFLNANSPHQELNEMGVSHDLCYRESHIGAFWSCFGCLYNFMKTIKWAAFSWLRSQINRPPLTNSGRQRNDMLWEHSKQLEWGVVWDYDTEDFTGFDLHWPEFFFTALSALSKKIAAASGEVLGFFCRPKRSRNSWSGVFFNYYF